MPPRLPNLLPPTPDAAAFAAATAGDVLVTGLDDGRVLCAVLERFILEPWAPVVPRCVLVAAGPELGPFAETYQPRYPSRLVIVEADPFDWAPGPQRFDWAWHSQAPDLDGFEELFQRYAPLLPAGQRRQGCAGLAALEAGWRCSALPWWRG